MAMVDAIMGEVRKGVRLCVALYGHPCVFVYPSREAIRQAREEGFEAVMQPGISAEDCLFADLNIDPAATGCQSFESTDFLIYKRVFDPRCSLILWQIGVIGDMSFDPRLERSKKGLKVLMDHLIQTYGAEHEVIIYEASQFVLCNPVIHRLSLSDLESAKVTGISTLYVAPLRGSIPNEDMLSTLGLRRDGAVLKHVTLEA